MILFLLFSLVILSLLGWIFFRERKIQLLWKEGVEKEAKIQQLEAAMEEGERSRRELKQSFQALSMEALEKNSKSFLELAALKFDKLQESARQDIHQKKTAIDELLKPIKESIDKSHQTHRELKEQLMTAKATFSEQVKGLLYTQNRLQNETQSLVKALRKPTVRGRWGEMQLKRVVELAGMVQMCDFVEQSSETTDSTRIRPDLIVKLPAGKEIVVDAKTPLQSYLDAIEAESDEEKALKLKDHARQLKTHIIQLSAKAYWEQFPNAPEFVVLFLPGESFFSAALESDPSLIEYGASQRVIIATPTTLISLLRSVAYGWRQETMAKNALEIASLGKELHGRLQLFLKNFSQIRKELSSAVTAYNQTIGSLESRVLVTARKLSEKTESDVEELRVPEPVEEQPRVSKLIESGQ